MSHTSGSSGSSLLHLHRPPQLQNDARTQIDVGIQDECQNDDYESVCSSPTSSVFHSSTVFCPPRTGPTLKLDCSSRHPSGQPGDIRRLSTTGHVAIASTFSNPADVEGCLDLLRSVQPSVRVAKPRSEWQPDADTAFCSQPSCTTMFSQTALSLGPRRHHCRLCGFIFCNTHSTGRMPLQTGDHQKGHRISLSRVCDSCFTTSHEESEDATLERRFSDATPSLASSDASARDDFIAEPISRSMSGSAIDQAPRKLSLAPIEEWMDRSGILSLYPLAVQSSHSRLAASSPVASRAVAPLFAPTLSERRSAHEKERHRLSLRRSRNVRLWISTPSGSGDEAEAEEQLQLQPASPTKTCASGTRTPLQERELDWSTF